MSWITSTIIIVIAAFALSFALTEWVAARRRTGRRDDDSSAAG